MAPRGQIQAAATLGTNTAPSPPSHPKSALAAHPPPHPLPKILPSPPQITSGWVVQASEAPASGPPSSLSVHPTSLHPQENPPPLSPPTPSRLPPLPAPLPSSSQSLPSPILTLGGDAGAARQRWQRCAGMGPGSGIAAGRPLPSEGSHLILSCVTNPHTHTHTFAATFPPPSCGKRRPAPTPPPVTAAA